MLVLQHCHAINTQFADPLPFVEVRATAHSIGKWIWRNFDEVAYRARQAHLGSKGGKVMTPAKIEANRKTSHQVRREGHAGGDHLMPGAKHPVRRKMTAREAAEQFELLHGPSRDSSPSRGTSSSSVRRNGATASWPCGSRA